MLAQYLQTITDEDVRRRYATQLRHFHAWMARRRLNVQTLQPTHFLRYEADLNELIDEVTAVAYIAAAHSYLLWLVQAGTVEQARFEELVGGPLAPPKARAVGQSWSEEQGVIANVAGITRLKLASKEKRPLWFHTAPEWRAAVAAQYEHISVDSWGLSARAGNPLVQHNPTMSVADVIRADATICSIRWVGDAAINELNRRVWAVLEASISEEPDLPRSIAEPTEPDPAECRPPIRGRRPLWFQTDSKWRDAIATQYDAISVESWSLSPRTRHPLLRHNPLITVGDVIRAGASIRSVRGIGDAAIAELDRKVWDLLDNHHESAGGERSASAAALPALTPADALSQLSSAAKQAPVGLLRVKRKAANRLKELGCTTLGDLLELASGAPRWRRGLSEGLMREINRALARVRYALTNDGNIDWFRYAGVADAQVLPSNTGPTQSLEDLLTLLPELMQQIILRRFGERVWIILQRRFGLDDMSELTLEELGVAFGITRERVRQLEVKALRHLRAVLLEQNYTDLDFYIHPALAAGLPSVARLVSETRLMREDRVRELLSGVLGVAIHVPAPYLLLLLAVAGASRISFWNSAHIAPAWGTISIAERDKIQTALNRLHRLLTRDHVAPLTEVDILVTINKNVAANKRLTFAQLRELIHFSNSIEARADGLYWAKFEHLDGRGSQTERILWEAGEPMKLSDVFREIRQRLAAVDDRQVLYRSYHNQIPNDPRFVPIGRSGYWGLSSWEHLYTDRIVDLIEECLVAHNRPLTVDEIYSYIRERRPLKKTSIAMYLLTDKKFARAGRATWGLASWEETRLSTSWNREQVAAFVAQLFKDAQARELEYAGIEQALMAAAQVSAREARGMLINPVIRTRVVAGRRVALFQPDYKDKLQRQRAATGRRGRIRRQVAAEVRALLEAAPNRQLPLPEIISSLLEADCAPKATLYSYIRDLDFIEQVHDPGSEGKVYRLKDAAEMLSPSADGPDEGVELVA